MANIKHRGSFETDDTYRGLPIHASLGVHAKVAELLTSRLPKGARIADLGAGHGALSLRLHDAGFSVDAFDFDSSDWPVAEISCRFCDLNESLHSVQECGPYDAICAVELIEHLENPRQFIRNLVAIAGEKDLWIVISTPNPLDTFSCLSLFTRGIFNWFSPAHYEGGGHISILPHWMISKHFEHSGVTIQDWFFLTPYRHPSLMKRAIYRAMVGLRTLFWKGPGKMALEGQTALLIARVTNK